MNDRHALKGTLLVLVVLAPTLSGIAPFDRTTWFMKVAPVLIVLPVLMLTRRTTRSPRCSIA